MSRAAQHIHDEAPFGARFDEKAGHRVEPIGSYHDSFCHVVPTTS